MRANGTRLLELLHNVYMRTHRPDEVTDKEMADRSDRCKTTESGVTEGRKGTEDGNGQLGQAAN